MKPEMKKLIIANLPYLLFVYLFGKLGQTYRLAAGADLSEKLLHLADGFSLAFESAAPSFHLFDLAVGVAGAVALRLMVYCKSKNAKKYRRGVEYGSARWGGPKDIAPYIDPVFDNNILLTQTERLTMNNRPKDPKTARNKNVLVIGGSGSGKTRFFVKPNLMQCVSKDYPTSFVITDPKGSLIGEVGQLLVRCGYRVKVLNTINFSKSMRYNPFRYIHSEKDILKLVNTLICNTKGEGEKSAEDFWIKSERLLYSALIGYIWYEAPDDEMNFTTLLEMINASEAREDDPEFQSPVDQMFERLEEKDPEHFAVRQYRKFLLSAGKTRSSILISCGARLGNFHGIGVSLAVRPRFGAVAGFRFDGLGQDVLLFKEHGKVALYLPQSEHAVMQRGEDGGQHIGIMFDLVQIETVFVIARVQAFVVVKFVLQVCFQRGIGGFGSQHITVLGEIGGGGKARPGAAKHGGAGLQAADHQQEHEAHAADDQRPFPVPGGKGRGLSAFLCGFLGCGSRGLGGACRPLCGLARRPCCLGIFPLDVLFLPEAGNGVLGRLRQLRVVPQGFLIRKLGVGGDGLSLGLGCGPVGFELVAVDAAADHAARLPFRQFLPLVAALHAHIFVFYLMDFSVEVKPGFLYGAAGRVWFELGRGFLHLVKIQPAFGLALGLVINGFLGDDTLFRQGFFSRFQLIRPFFCLFDIRGQLRGGPFLGGKLQPGNGAGGLHHSFPGVLGRFLCPVAVVQFVRPFQYFFRRALRLGGVFLLGLPAGHIDAFAGGLVIQRQAVAGHVLRYLVAGF